MLLLLYLVYIASVLYLDVINYEPILFCTVLVCMCTILMCMCLFNMIFTRNKKYLAQQQEATSCSDAVEDGSRVDKEEV